MSLFDDLFVFFEYLFALQFMCILLFCAALWLCNDHSCGTTQVNKAIIMPKGTEVSKRSEMILFCHILGR